MADHNEIRGIECCRDTLSAKGNKGAVGEGHESEEYPKIHTSSRTGRVEPHNNISNELVPILVGADEIGDRYEECKSRANQICQAAFEDRARIRGLAELVGLLRRVDCPCSKSLCPSSGNWYICLWQQWFTLIRTTVGTKDVGRAQGDIAMDSLTSRR